MSEVLGVKVGDVATYERTVTAEDIEKFAEGSGDTNPLHRDPEYAKKTRFGECIAHGMLSAGYISTVSKVLSLVLCEIRSPQAGSAAIGDNSL